MLTLTNWRPSHAFTPSIENFTSRTHSYFIEVLSGI